MSTIDLRTNLQVNRPHIFSSDQARQSVDNEDD